MKIKDNEHNLDLAIKTFVETTDFHVSRFEMISIIRQFMKRHNMTNEDFIKYYVGK